MLASAPAAHSLAWRLSDPSISVKGATTPAQRSAISLEPAVMFISAPAAYSLDMMSPFRTMADKCSSVPAFASSCLTSGQRHDKFMMANAASATWSLSSFSSGDMAPADHTASQGASSAASIASACVACRLASSVAFSLSVTAMSDGIRSGACSKPACTLALWSLNRLANAPAERSWTAMSSSWSSFARGLNAPASTMRSLILPWGARFMISAAALRRTSTSGLSRRLTDFRVTCAL
mmetsp:Transcript_113142/g.325282  ORF Transcript_113142/g.325282 Transcript_113142/m.325282 type:complete len:237 (-) Transcript_113142:1463-2173(-)